MAHGVMPCGNGGAVRTEAHGVYAACGNHADGGCGLGKAEAAVRSFGGRRGLGRSDVDGLIGVVVAAANHCKRGQQRKQQGDPFFRIHCIPPKIIALKSTGREAAAQ